MQVVRDQCWLNETLRSCAWIPETAEDLQEGGAGDAGDASAGLGPGSGADTTEDELNAILNGALYSPALFSFSANSYRMLIGNSTV